MGYAHCCECGDCRTSFSFTVRHNSHCRTFSFFCWIKSNAGEYSLDIKRLPATVEVINCRAGSLGFDPELYKRYNVLERCFNRLKQFRAVATRYDKLKNRYEATVTIASIMIWLRAKPDRSRP